MRHSEITKAPRQCGNDREESIRGGRPVNRVIRLCKTQVTGQAARIFHNRSESACLADAEHQNNYQRDGHDDTLDKVSRAGCEETAHGCVEHDDDRADDHRRMVVHAEQAVEELSAGGKARCRIRNKENDNDKRRDQGQNIFFVAETVGEEFRQRNGIRHFRITPEFLCHQKPVKICTDCKSDHGPAYVRNTGQVRQSRQSHQKITAHIGCFRTHRGDERPELSSAQEEITHGFILFRQFDTDSDHTEQVNGHCNQHGNL